MKKKLFLLFFYFPIFCFAQNQRFDSLLKAFQEVKKMPSSAVNDSLKIMAIDNVLFETNNIISQDSLLNYLSKIAENSSWEKAKAYQSFIVGSSQLWQKNNLYLAFNHLENALSSFIKMNDSRMILQTSDRFVPLLNWNMIENKIPEKVREKYVVFMKECIKLGEAQKDTAIWSNTEITLAAFYLFVFKDYQKCLFHANNQIRLLENLDRKTWFSYYYMTKLGMSICYLNLGKEKEGEQMVNEIVAACKKDPPNRNNQYVLSQLSSFIGRYYLSKNDFKTAEKYGLLAEKNLFFGSFPYFVNVYNKMMYQAYRGLKNNDKAIVYLEKLREYEENTEKNKLIQSFAEWQLKYDDEKQKNMIKSLENEKLQRQNDKQDLLRNVLIISLLAGLGIVFYIFGNNQKLKEKNLLLETKNREIEEALYKGQSLERKRVATELHDSLSSKISGIKMRLEAVQPNFNSEKQQKIYQSSVSALAEVYTDVRLISHNLLPAELELRGLEKAVQNFVNELNSLDKTNFDFKISENFGRFGYKIEYEIFSIILELSNNIMKHSQAKVAMISLQNDEKLLKLEVSDNGIGFNEQNFIEGMGMENIKSRVNSLKGKMEVFNQNGVFVQIEVPV